MYGETLDARVCVSFMCLDFITMGNVLFLISVLAACCQQPPLHTLTQTIILWFLINHHSSAHLWYSQLEHSVTMGQRCDVAFCSTTYTLPFHRCDGFECDALVDRWLKKTHCTYGSEMPLPAVCEHSVQRYVQCVFVLPHNQVGNDRFMYHEGCPLLVTTSLLLIYISCLTLAYNFIIETFLRIMASTLLICYIYVHEYFVSIVMFLCQHSSGLTL